MQCDPNLFQIAATHHLTRCLAGTLHRGQQQCNKHADDGEYNEQFDESESTTAITWNEHL
jgi:gamma-glutamyl:cysteine ligase YbdK (ATP-grasp superfamily)